MTRRTTAVALALTIGVGVASRRFPIGVHLWDKSLGDALYTVMVYLLVALARPNLRPATLGAIALGISVAIELFQLTGIPLRLPRAFRFALGTTFAWHDLACYAAGAVAASLAHHVTLRRRVR